MNELMLSMLSAIDVESLISRLIENSSSLNEKWSTQNQLWKCFRLSSRGGWIELWNIFFQFRPLKMVFTIWKTLTNLGARDIRCSKEINWFKARMNQFVIQTDRSFSSTQQIHNSTDLQFQSSTLIRLNSHSSNSNITLKSESRTNPNLNESSEEQNHKVQI